MSIEFIFRLIGMFIFGGLGVYGGVILANISNNPPVYYGIVLGLVGALVGLILTPFLTTRPIKAIRSILAKVSVQTLMAGLMGLLAGLILAAMLAFPISLLPKPLGNILPFVGALLFSYFGVMVFIMRQNEIFGLFRINIPSKNNPESPAADNSRVILLDTSVIIDGRIGDIARTGFLMGTLLIPRFVLNELQYIADSPDGLRRQRGRRGMEVLAQLQKNALLPVKISDIDVEGIREVDEKLVILARQLRAPILTNDYNLNRVAELQGVAVLNVNELANAVKSVMLPGEALNVNVIQEGKEVGQGVGYLDDGTMVVIEDGRDHLNQNIYVIVTKVLQTAAGRMIFARMADKQELESIERG